MHHAVKNYKEPFEDAADAILAALKHDSDSDSDGISSPDTDDRRGRNTLTDLPIYGNTLNCQ